MVFHGEELRRVLISLLDNAFNATGPEDRAPEMRTSRRGGTLIFEVQDFGCGMSPSILRQATRAFFTTRRDQDDTSLPDGKVKLSFGWAVGKSAVELSSSAAKPTVHSRRESKSKIATRNR